VNKRDCRKLPISTFTPLIFHYFPLHGPYATAMTPLYINSGFD